MVSMLLNRVATLTVVALSIICKTGKVTARASGVAKSQTQAFDSMPILTQLRSRRRLPGEPTSILSAFTHSSVEKSLFPEHDLYQKQIVTDLFDSHEVKRANAQTFFKSRQFMKWESEVKAGYGSRTEELLFSAMYDNYNARDNGGVVAIIAQAMKGSDTHKLGSRFEDLLLDKLAPGVERAVAGSNEDADFGDLLKYLRYSYYRDSEDMSVHQKMMEKLHDPGFPEWIRHFKGYLREKSKTPFVHLDYTFEIISGGRGVADVFNELSHVEGFNNNAYLLRKLYEQADTREINVHLADYMLTRLREAGWTNFHLSDRLLVLIEDHFSPDLSQILLKPLIGEFLSQSLHWDALPKRVET